LQKPDECVPGQGLASAGFADDPEYLSASEVEADRVDRRDAATSTVEADGQISDGKRGRSRSHGSFPRALCMGPLDGVAARLFNMIVYSCPRSQSQAKIEQDQA
jgi:hypothetical protein